MKSYLDALVRRKSPPTSYKEALGPSRLGSDGRPVWPLRTDEWPSRQGVK